MRLASSFFGFNSEVSSRQSKSSRVSLVLDASKSKRKDAFKKRSTADEWIADAREEGSRRVALSLEPSKSRKATVKKNVCAKVLIAEDAREDVDVVCSKSTLEREDAERQGGEEFPAIHIGPYEEMLAGSGSFPNKSRRLKVKTQNFAAIDDRKRRYANELCHVLDQFAFDDRSLINQVYDQSSITARPKELATSKEGFPGPILADIDPNKIPLKKLVCGERYACADYIDDAAEGWKDMMRSAGGCNGNEIIEYIADWDGESYDTSTYESLNTIEAKIKESLRASVSIDSNDGTVESDLSMSQCARSTRSFEDNFCGEIEVSAEEFHEVVETNTMDSGPESLFATVGRTADVEWNCSSVGSVLTEKPTTSFIAEEPSIVEDAYRVKCIQIQPTQMSKGKSFGDNEDSSVVTRAADVEEISVSNNVSPKKNALFKSFFFGGKEEQDGAKSKPCDPRQNVDTETQEYARQEIALKKFVDDSMSPDETADRSITAVDKSMKSSILNHVVVLQASSEASVSMQCEEASVASNLDKTDGAAVHADSTSDFITASNGKELNMTGNWVQGQREPYQLCEAVAIEMKLSEESESSNRVKKICSDTAGGVDSFSRSDPNSSYPQASESTPPEQYESAYLEFNEKEGSLSDQLAFEPHPVGHREMEVGDGGGAVPFSTVPHDHTKPHIDTGAAQWAESNMEDLGVRRAPLLSTIPARTKADFETGAGDWAQNIDWDSFLNEGIKSKSISRMSLAATTTVALPQSEERPPRKVSLVKSFFGKTKKKRYCDKKMGEEAQ